MQNLDSEFKAALAARVALFSKVHNLSRRQEAVLLLGAAGLSNKAIASELGMSLSGVYLYRSRICSKLYGNGGAKALAQLLREAVSPETPGSVDRQERRTASQN